MPSNKPMFTMIIDDELKNKAKFIAERDGRSLANLIVKLLKEEIESYERLYGPIQIDNSSKK